MNGYILVDKPATWTSFDVVAKVRSYAKQAIQTAGVPAGQTIPKRVKVGHTGTLDPLATGLLVVLVGTYTKRAAELTKLPKTYQVTMRLGQTSTTGDDEGEKTAGDDHQVSLQELQASLERHTGNLMQVPPLFSAMKIDGQRAYKLARAGKEVILEPRPVTVDWLQLDAYVYPEVRFTVHVSSGTYIRSLVMDIGTDLGVGAYMSGLRRTTVGQFKLEDAIPMAELDAESLAARLRTLPSQG